MVPSSKTLRTGSRAPFARQASGLKRELKVVSDDSALEVAVDEALAAAPDVAEKIRGGKVQIN